MEHYSIPSKWTKEDFCWAAFCARLDTDFDAYDVLNDVLMCFQYGFEYSKRNYGMRVNWSLLQGEVDKRRGGYYNDEEVGII